MSIYLVLDLLLILLIALFAPIGYWRGPVKELLVTFGVLFGILLADFWARPWGRDLADITAIGSSGGAFVVAMAFLVTVTFVLGYGAGAAIAPTNFSRPARMIGGGIALFNGILLIGFSLQYVRVFLLSPDTEEALYDSYVVRFLLDEIGWLLLIVALVAWPLLLGILITGRRAYEHVDEYSDYGYDVDDGLSYDDDPYYEEQQPARAYDRGHSTADTRAFPPRVPTSQSDESAFVYKAEPATATSLPTDETRPIRVSDEWQSPERPAPEIEESAYDPGHTDPAMVTIPAREDLDFGEHSPEGRPPSGAEEIDESDLAPGYSRCVNCHAVLPPDARVCPVCGEVN
jgi:uncharacterized membrane protein required for colicin V production